MDVKRRTSNNSDVFRDRSTPPPARFQSSMDANYTDCRSGWWKQKKKKKTILCLQWTLVSLRAPDKNDTGQVEKRIRFKYIFVLRNQHSTSI